MIFSVVYYCLIVFLAGYLNIWEDELYSINTSSGSLSYAFNQSFNFENQPPVYFMLLKLWRIISDSVLWARLFSVILILFSQLLLYRFIKDLTDKRTAAFFSVIFLLNPMILFAILEIRAFALVLLLSLLIFINFHGIYYNDQITTRGRIVFILLAISGLFTQYFIGFLLFANAVVLLAERKFKPLKLYIVDMLIPLGLLFLFMPGILTGSDLQASSFPEYSRTLKDYFIEIKGLGGQITFSYFLPFSFIESQLLQKIFKTGIILLLLASINYARIKETFRRLSPYIITSVVIFFFFVIVLWFFGKYAVENKYLMVLFVPVFILILTIFRFFRPGMQYIWVTLFVLIYVANDYSKYHELYKVKDFRSLGSFIEMDEKINMPLFVHRNISAENLGYYYNGINQINPVPDHFSYGEAFGQSQWKIDEEDLISLTDKLKSYSEFYIVIDNSPLRGVKESSEYLMNYLVTNFNKVSEVPFRGKIILYKFSNIKFNDSPQ